MTYNGPVLFISYLADVGNHYFFVNDPSKLPEKAVGVRVPADSPLQAAMFYAFDKKVPAMVSPANRWSGPDGKLFWSIDAIHIGQI